LKNDWKKLIDKCNENVPVELDKNILSRSNEFYKNEKIKLGKNPFNYVAFSWSMASLLVVAILFWKGRSLNESFQSISSQDQVVLNNYEFLEWFGQYENNLDLEQESLSWDDQDWNYILTGNS